jgi:hypothetical protein
LYLNTEVTDVKHLQPAESLLHISNCFKLFASHMPFESSKGTEIAGHEFGTLGSMVLPAIALE